MGTAAPDILQIIHIGPPSSPESFNFLLQVVNLIGKLNLLEYIIKYE